MSDRASDFANEWVRENISTEAYDPPASTIDRSVEELVTAAEAEGIDRDALEEVVGDLRDFIAEAYEEATDSEVERLASKDD
jgi:hypothetical protein